MAEHAPDELKKAREAAYRLLARRDRSRAEIETKLAERRFSPEAVRQTIERLTSLGYLDDSAFARSHARYLMEHRPMGRRRLAWELGRKGLEERLVDEAVEEAFAGRSERDLAKEVAERRLGAYRGLDSPAVRRRLKGYLERRGFPFDDISAVLRELSQA